MKRLIKKSELDATQTNDIVKNVETKTQQIITEITNLSNDLNNNYNDLKQRDKNGVLDKIFDGFNTEIDNLNNLSSEMLQNFYQM